MSEPKERRLLWIDDELKTTVRFTVLGVELAGYVVEEATSIDQTFSKLNAYATTSDVSSLPGLVILDIMMPITEADEKALAERGKTVASKFENSMRAGLSLITEIQGVLHNVPIFVLTNLGEETEVGHKVFEELRKEKQVKVLLSKPQPLETILGHIEHLMGSPT